MQFIDEKSERLVLGCVLSHPKTIDSVLTLINKENFTLPRYRLIFEAFKSLDEESKPINVKTVDLKLQEFGVKEEKSMAALFSLRSEGGIPELVPDLCRKLKKATIARNLFEAVEKAKRDFEDGEDTESIIDGLNRTLEGFDEVDHEHESDMRTQLEKTIDRVQKRMSGELVDVGIPTGIEDLDKIISLRNGELIIAGARPGRGKSALLNQIRINSIRSGGYRTGFISLEMSSEQMSERTIANIAGISLGEIQGRTQFDPNDIPRLQEAIQSIKSKEHPECYRPDMTIQSIRQIARRWKRQVGIDLLFIDYTQLIDGGRDGKGKNRVEIVSEISRGLKLMAKELQIPVVTASQLNRSSEESDKPSLRHLRESGSIEQDADIVLLLHEEALENGTVKNSILIAKNRSGREGEVQISFQKPVQRIA